MTFSTLNELNPLIAYTPLQLLKWKFSFECNLEKKKRLAKRKRIFLKGIMV